jgi:hypothetical protein
MSKKMMIAVIAGTISLLADHPASARGGGAHGGLHPMPGAAVTSSGNGAQTARPNIGLIGNGTGTVSRPMSGTGASPPVAGTNTAGTALPTGLPASVSSPTIPSNVVGTSSAGAGGASSGSASGGGLNNPGINPNGTGVSGTGASPPVAGTNTAGTALSSGLPTSSGTDHLTTGQSADRAKRRADEDGVFDSESAKIGPIVKSICTRC